MQEFYNEAIMINTTRKIKYVLDTEFRTTSSLFYVNQDILVCYLQDLGHQFLRK